MGKHGSDVNDVDSLWMHKKKERKSRIMPVMTVSNFFQANVIIDALSLSVGHAAMEKNVAFIQRYPF